MVNDIDFRLLTRAKTIYAHRLSGPINRPSWTKFDKKTTDHNETMNLRISLIQLHPRGSAAVVWRYIPSCERQSVLLSVRLSVCCMVG